MPTKDRQRALARAKLERQMARRAAAARRRRQIQAAIGAGLAVIVVLAGVVFLVTQYGGDDEDKSTTDDNTTAAGSGCEYQAEKTEGAKVKDVGLPATDNIPRSGTRTATMTTNLGPVTFTLDQAKAPCTVNSIVFLASKKFYDKTTCHRMTTEGIHVLQCGDPFGDGTGGPSYRFGTENLPTGLHPSYPAGTVAMAKASDPISVGSQFFIVYKDTELPADYTIVGTVTKGLDLIQNAAKKGVTPTTPENPGDGKPKQAINITSLTISPAAGASPTAPASPTATASPAAS